MGADLCSATDSHGFRPTAHPLFGTEEVGDLAPEALAAGIDRLLVQFGLERDSGRRFALWCLAYMLGAAPDLDIAFKEEAEREAARDFMDTIDREIDEDG